MPADSKRGACWIFKSNTPMPCTLNFYVLYRNSPNHGHWILKIQLPGLYLLYFFQAIVTNGGGVLFGIFDGHGGAACGQVGNIVDCD